MDLSENVSKRVEKEGPFSGSHNPESLKTAQSLLTVKLPKNVFFAKVQIWGQFQISKINRFGAYEKS